MKFILLTLSIFTLFSMVYTQIPCAPSKHAKLPVTTGLTYHSARRALLKNGWQPHQTISHNEASDDVNLQYGNGPLFWGRGYYELASCSGTGMGHCVFLFDDAFGNRLSVTTQGEEGRSGKRYYYARVSRYQFECE